MVRSFAQTHPFALLTSQTRLSDLMSSAVEEDGGDGQVVVRPDETSRDLSRNDPILMGGVLVPGSFDEADEHSEALRRHAKLWLLSRSAKATFGVKNVRLTEQDVVSSGLRWVYGMHGGQSKGYPASNFGLGRMDRKEQRILKKNNAGTPPFDPDDKHWR